MDAFWAGGPTLPDMACDPWLVLSQPRVMSSNPPNQKEGASAYVPANRTSRHLWAADHDVATAHNAGYALPVTAIRYCNRAITRSDINSIWENLTRCPHVIGDRHE